MGQKNNRRRACQQHQKPPRDHADIAVFVDRLGAHIAAPYGRRHTDAGADQGGDKIKFHDTDMTRKALRNKTREDDSLKLRIRLSNLPQKNVRVEYMGVNNLFTRKITMVSLLDLRH